MQKLIEIISWNQQNFVGTLGENGNYRRLIFQRIMFVCHVCVAFRHAQALHNTHSNTDCFHLLKSVKIG